MNDSDPKVPAVMTKTAKARKAREDRPHGATSPRHPGKVWCCVTLGWIPPAEAFDHVWDAYSGTDW